MELSCLRYTQIPGTSKLFADYLYHFDRVAGFYAHSPHDPESYRRAAAEVDYPADRRGALIEALRTLNEGNPALDVLAQPGTVAVLTGQQVGLFGGPAYTFYKALTAVRLAAQLTAQGQPAVPVFWLATEDHDFDEIDHAWTFDGTMNPVRLPSTGEVRPHQPVGLAKLADLPLDAMAGALAGLPDADAVMGLLRRHYVTGGGYGKAFLGLLRELLGRFGLLFADPLDPAIRTISGQAASQAAALAPELCDALMERSKELEAAGYHAQVLVEPQTSPLFLLRGGVRTALKRHGLEFQAKDLTMTAAELSRQGAALSPNALLRPVVQDYLFPTVAVVGGPAEIAYFAQSEVLYRRILGRMPVMVPRAAFTLIDARGGKVMDRYGFRAEDCLQGPAPMLERVSRQLVPAELAGRFAAAETEMNGIAARLCGDVSAFDPTLGQALEKSRKKIAYQLSKIAAKTHREAVRRNGRAQEDVRYLANLIQPGGHLQERRYSILPFLARYGADLLDRIHGHVQLDCPDHKVIPL